MQISWRITDNTLPSVTVAAEKASRNVVPANLMGQDQSWK